VPRLRGRYAPDMASCAPDIDLLTAAWNRDRFEVELSRAVSWSHRTGRPLSLLFVDVDDAQELNDLHGEEAVDGALSGVAEVLSQVVDGRGPIARLGGDDFAVLLTDCSRESALRLARGAVSAVARRRFPCGSGEFRITISAGVAIARRGEPWGNLVEAAESACTRAKQGGRNAVASR
jgi:diguanylate cyclase (GGDEF)-like protein